jgi:hypothetical protein
LDPDLRRILEPSTAFRFAADIVFRGIDGDVPALESLPLALST